MNETLRKGLWMLLGAALLGGALVLTRGTFGHAAEEKGAPEKGAMTPHYTVVETEGTNLLVTDNQTNTLYYYTIDRDEKPGAPLMLRGQVDLKEVGKPVIKPVLHKAEEKPKEK